MKSTIKGKEASTENGYPKLMENANQNIVVLFSEYEKGTVVNSSNEDWMVGEYCRQWDMDMFHDFHGTILLEN